jgi:hypothetical protein
LNARFPFIIPFTLFNITNKFFDNELSYPFFQHHEIELIMVDFGVVEEVIIYDFIGGNEIKRLC